MNSEYIKRQSQWQLLNDCYDETVKNKTTEYLPMPQGQKNDTDNGVARYQSFLTLAKYYNYLKQSVDNFANCIMRKEPIIKLPESLEYLRSNCNYDNESLEMLLNEVYLEQLKTGRIGLIIDVVEETNEFKIIKYNALDIIDWHSYFINGSKELVYVLIKEEDYYRVLFLDETYKTCIMPSKNYDKIKTKLIKNKEVDFSFLYEYNPIEVKYNGKSLNYIPFTFANISNTRAETEQPFLLNQANLSIGLYQLDADHTLLCHKQAFSILFAKGIQSNDSGKTIDMDGIYDVDNVDADLKFVGVSGAGLSEVRQEKESLKKDVASFGIIAQDKSVQESENSLKIRIQLTTDKLISISRTGARALEWVLETIAIWQGSNPYEIEIIANTDFRTEPEKTAEFLNMSELYKAGTLTEYDFWKWQYNNNYTKYQYEEWKKEINIEDTENNNIEQNEKDSKNE